MKKIFLPFMACTAMMFVACSEKDLYDPAQEQKIVKDEYKRNFIKQYGADVLKNNTWDYSEGAMLTRAGEITEYSYKTVAGINYNLKETVTKQDNNYVITSTPQQNTEYINDITKALPDGKQQKGQKAVLTAPNNGFTIYPVSAQGAYTYDLYVKVGDNKPIKVFSKDWTEFSHAYYNGMGTKAENKGTNENPNYVITDRANMRGVYIEAPIGTPIQIYLDNIKNGSKVVTTQKVGTASGNAIILNDNGKIPTGIAKEIGLVAGAVAKYVGIEDNIFNADGTGGGDKDFNDLVVAIVGNPYTPQPLVIEDGQYTVKTKTEKRYMIEDLGDTDDFDFNDVVVDVVDNTEIVHSTVTTNGVITKDEITSTTHKQTATIRHLGGTLPFTLKIGDITLPEHVGVLDEDVEEVYEIEGWKPAQNNISITVRNKNNDHAPFEISFPEKGEAPMIIATSITKQWMAERERVNWF